MLDPARRKLSEQLDPTRWPGTGLSPLNAVICVTILPCGIWRMRWRHGAWNWG